jgi:hypothetical protein
LINGTFRVTGGVPGGDSVRFHPDDPQALSVLRLPARTDSRGAARLRLAGVDALVTAFTPRGSLTRWHQPLELAEAGATALATALGFDRIERGDNGSAVASTPVAVPGHVLVQSVDVHGRLVGFAFPARRRGPVADLCALGLDVAGVRDSVNWMLLRQGLGYPVVYSALALDLRTELFAAAEHARDQQRGIWPRDITGVGARLERREQLRDRFVLFPKLFRRLADYLELSPDDGVDLSGFSDYLASRGDRVLVLPQGQVTGFDAVVEVREHQLRLGVPVQRVVFFER